MSVSSVTADSFEAQLESALARFLPEASRSWAGEAARVFAAELQLRGASPHRSVVEELAKAWGIPPSAAGSVGVVLDSIQVAIDVADNLADEEEDRAAGRDVDARYRCVPRPFLICLPAALLNSIFALLSTEFAPPKFNLQRATRRLAWTLAEMAEGQAATELSEKIRLASGKQGLLLCLPAWLTPDHTHPVPLQELERWAMAFGQSWEHAERHRTQPSPAARAAWNQARLLAEEAWPSAPPFDDRGPLARHRLLAPMMC